MSRRVCCRGWQRTWNSASVVSSIIDHICETDVCVIVDTATTQRDSLKRLAFVAAFAMSNYSSTIGRIAKPFNPMLVCGPDSNQYLCCTNDSSGRARLLSM